MKEKKSEKPKSIKFEPKTEEAIYKACQAEDRSMSYIVERAVKRDLGLIKS